MMKTFIKILIFIAFMLPINTVAKCVVNQLTIKGNVRLSKCCDCDDTYPIDGAMVFLFINDMEMGSSGTTDENGYFEIHSTFSTSNGGLLFFFENCSAKPKTATCVIFKEGFDPKITKLKLINRTVQDDLILYEIPEILFYKVR